MRLALVIVGMWTLCVVMLFRPDVFRPLYAWTDQPVFAFELRDDLRAMEVRALRAERLVHQFSYQEYETRQQLSACEVRLRSRGGSNAARF